MKTRLLCVTKQLPVARCVWRGWSDTQIRRASKPAGTDQAQSRLCRSTQPLRHSAHRSLRRRLAAALSNHVLPQSCIVIVTGLCSFYRAAWNADAVLR